MIDPSRPVAGIFRAPEDWIEIPLIEGGDSLISTAFTVRWRVSIRGSLVTWYCLTEGGKTISIVCLKTTLLKGCSQSTRQVVETRYRLPYAVGDTRDEAYRVPSVFRSFIAISALSWSALSNLELSYALFECFAQSKGCESHGFC